MLQSILTCGLVGQQTLTLNPLNLLNRFGTEHFLWTPCIMILRSNVLQSSKCYSWRVAMKVIVQSRNSSPYLPYISVIVALKSFVERILQKMWILITARIVWKICLLVRQCCVECDVPNVGSARCVRALWHLALPIQAPRSLPIILRVAIVAGVPKVSRKQISLNLGEDFGYFSWFWFIFFIHESSIFS